MKVMYKLQASRKTLIRWASQEAGIKNARRVLLDGSLMRAFGANKDGAFKTRREADILASRIQTMAAFVAGKLGKKDYASVDVSGWIKQK